MTAMSVLAIPRIPQSRPVRSTLTTDADQLAALAEELNGRPVPGVRMTERQFVDWSTPTAIPAEWENGEIILMTTPSVTHAELSGWLYRFLIEFVEANELGTVLLPLTVRLAEVQRRRDPDLLFIAKSRLRLLRDNHLEGPPDLAVEIVSPDSSVRDWQTKHAEYAEAGVKEYWVADPLIRRFEAYALYRGKYRALPTDDDGRVHSKLLKGLHVRPEWLWRKPMPRVSTVMKEQGKR